MRLEHASYSALNLFEQCPLRFKIERVEKRKAPDAPPLRIGSAVHAAIAAYIRHLQEENLQTDFTWAAIALVEADAVMSEEGRILSADEWEEVTSIFNGFVSSHMFDPSCVAEVEKREKIPLDGLTFWTVIDLLEVEDGQAKLWDWKSSWKVLSQAEVARDFQLRVYAWAVHKLYGYDEVRCALDFVRHGAIREVVIGPEEIAATEERILKSIAAIEAETEWTPTPGSHCSWCPWAGECPLMEGEDPEELAGRILVLEGQLREAQAKLKEYCNEHGPVTVGGETFGYLPPKDGGYTITDKPAFAAALDSHGLDPWDYFNVNSTKLKSIRTAKKWRHVLADVEPLLEQDISTKFTHRKEG
ncbi:MAG: PD-(D/E)XK nuclease family protein, partial [Sphaerochaeta sp.]|nr:PD-(D/E)XK nuclease family protein [Sphaerochaeta sp.]